MFEKKWYESRGVWGGIVSVLAGVVALIGYTVSPGDIEAIAGLLTAIGAAFGGMLSIYGRITAIKEIK